MPADGVRDGSSRGDRILVASLLASCVLAAASTTADPDMFHALALGREMAVEGTLPTVDAFAFTPTRTPVVHHEWLFGLILYRILTATGVTGFLAFKWGLHFASIALVVAVARARGASAITLAFLAPHGIGLAGLGMTTLRAQALTLACAAATIAVTELDRRGGRRWMLAYVPLYVVWLNCHGGFVVGPAILACHAVEQALRREPTRHLWLFLGMLTALVFVNPYGAAYPAYLWEALRMDRSNIGEWRALGDEHAWALPIWGFSLLVFVYAWLPDGLRAQAGWVLTLLAGVAAYRHQRHLSLYALAWIAAVPPIVERRRLALAFRNVWNGRPALARLAVTVGIAASLAAATRHRWWAVAVPTRPADETTVVYPAGAVEYLRRNAAAGNLVTPFELGAYVSWHCAPAIRVSLDGRYEAAFVEPRALADAHVAFYQGLPAWRSFLTRHPSDLVLARRTDPVVTRLPDDGWRPVYEDDVFLVFARAGVALPIVHHRGRIASSFP